MDNTPQERSLLHVIFDWLKNYFKNSLIKLLVGVVCAPLLGVFLYVIARKYGPLRAEAQFDLSILFIYLLVLLMLSFAIGAIWVKWVTNKKRSGAFPWRASLRYSILGLGLVSLGIVGKIVTDVSFLKCLFLPCVPISVAIQNRSTSGTGNSNVREEITLSSSWDTYSIGKTGITLASPGALQKNSTFPDLELYAYSSHSFEVIVMGKPEAMSKQEVIETTLSSVRRSNMDTTIDKQEEKTITAAGRKALFFSVGYHRMGREFTSENVIFLDKTRTRIVSVVFLNSDTNQARAQRVLESVKLRK